MHLAWQLDLPDSQKIVLLALADCANDEGHCWPSMATLAKKCSKGERTVQGVIKKLVDDGHITREERLGKGCNYWIHPRRDCAPQAPRPAKVAPTPAAAADKPSKNHHSSSPPTPHRENDWPEIPSWIPAEPWNGFLEMRKRKKDWPTARAITLMIGKLERWKAQGHDPGTVLDASTENGWTGLWEPKNGRSKKFQSGGNKGAGSSLGRAIDEAERHLTGP